MNLKEIQTIIRNFEKSDLTYLELETEGFKIKLSKNRQDPETPKTETKTEPGKARPRRKNRKVTPSVRRSWEPFTPLPLRARNRSSPSAIGSKPARRFASSKR